jgi:YD repeat-containing protein
LQQVYHTYGTEAYNRLTTDGVYDYLYDYEGNLLTRTKIADGSYREFTWDHRNRLTSVSDYDAETLLLQQVTYTYDAFDRLIGRQADRNGDYASDVTEAFIYDGDQIILQFAGESSPDALTHRYLWGPAVDQLLADEEVTSLAAAGTVSWALGDHQNTVRDVVQSSGGTTSVVNHNAYDSFGNQLTSTSPEHDLAFELRQQTHEFQRRARPRLRLHRPLHRPRHRPPMERQHARRRTLVRPTNRQMAKRR